MSGTRFSLLLATTAIVMVLAGPSHKAFAGPTTDADISAAVPMPESANLAPPTVDDLATVTEEPTGASLPFPPDRALAPAPVAGPCGRSSRGGRAGEADCDPRAARSRPGDADRSGARAAPAAPVPAAAAAPEATPAPVPAAEAPPAVPLTLDQKIAQKIQELIGTKGDRILDRKYKAAVEAYYQAHSYAPVWIDDGHQNNRAKAATAYLGGVDADGLDPADYIVPSFAGDEAALAEAELKMTAAVLHYPRHASTGRIHYSRVSPDILYNLVTPEPAEVLGKVVEAKNVGQALDSFEPPHAGLQGAQGEARGSPRRQHVRPHQQRPGAQGRHGRPARSDAARPVRPARGGRHHLRQGARRRGEEIPEAAQAQADRRVRQRRRSMRSTARATSAKPTSSSPTWSVGAGSRATSAKPM